MSHPTPAPITPALPIVEHGGDRTPAEGRTREDRFVAACAARGLILTDRALVARALEVYDMVVRIGAADSALARYAHRTGAPARIIFPDFDELDSHDPARPTIRRMMREALEAADGPSAVNAR